MGIILLLWRIDARHRRLKRQLEERNRALSQERFLAETLMDHTPDHIYFKDLRSRFLRINRALAEIFKLKDPAEAIGKTDFDYFLPEHAQQAFADEQEILRTGKPLIGREEKETWPDGAVTWVSTKADGKFSKAAEFKFLYPLEMSIKDKIETIVREMYGGSGVEYSAEAEKKSALDSVIDLTKQRTSGGRRA